MTCEQQLDLQEKKQENFTTPGLDTYFRAIRRAPKEIKQAPIKLLRVNCSPSNRTAKIKTKTILSLSRADAAEAEPYLIAAKLKSQERAPAMPENAISIRDFLSIVVNRFALPSEKESVTKKNAIMQERTVVASVLSMSLSPSLAKIGTRPAKTAPNSAYSIHNCMLILFSCRCGQKLIEQLYATITAKKRQKSCFCKRILSILSTIAVQSCCL